MNFEQFLREKHVKNSKNNIEFYTSHNHVSTPMFIYLAEEWHRQEEGKYKIDSIRNNEVNLCGSCCNQYPDCGDNKVIFGDGIGNDNIVACNKYEAITFRHPSQNGRL